jgi:hypothetical protein
MPASLLKMRKRSGVHVRCRPFSMRGVDGNGSIAEGDSVHSSFSERRIVTTAGNEYFFGICFVKAIILIFIKVMRYSC